MKIKLLAFKRRGPGRYDVLWRGETVGSVTRLDTDAGLSVFDRSGWYAADSNDSQLMWRGYTRLFKTRRAAADALLTRVAHGYKPLES